MCPGGGVGAVLAVLLAWPPWLRALRVCCVRRLRLARALGCLVFRVACAWAGWALPTLFPPGVALLCLRGVRLAALLPFASCCHFPNSLRTDAWSAVALPTG